jgi:hypothetical protein
MRTLTAEKAAAFRYNGFLYPLPAVSLGRQPAAAPPTR